ncbi:MAG: hypothetical protein GEU83_06610 [Pseudonocardiaceae bacterium]|nr:hypothetical protein [Pseudonocardiaceae bacterium]
MASMEPGGGRVVSDGPMYSYESPPAPAAGPPIEVTPDDVLSKGAALMAEVADLERFLDSIREDLGMDPCGGDPVSEDVARAVTHRTIGGEDSYHATFRAWIDNLYDTAEALKQAARGYGFTEEEIEASFRGEGGDVRG